MSPAPFGEERGISIWRNQIFTATSHCLVDTFMPAIREKMAKRFVKKTLSIPAWLNAQAESYGINFSQTLQKALKQELKLAQ